MFKWLQIFFPMQKPFVPRTTFADRYELIKQIGEGGMAVVWKARQRSLGRLVAIKKIRPAVFTKTGLARFKTEAQLEASLRHPGIVTVFEFGESDDGEYYLCMDFIEGPTLATRLAGGPLPPRDAAAIVHGVAEAVQFTHEHGIIHRDLKPGNILLDAQQAGCPLLADFGLARKSDLTMVDVTDSTTIIGTVLGTPGYMSPEQASGQTDRVGKPTDVFALGAILYHSLVGRTPYSSSNPLEVCSPSPIPSPRTILEDIPPELDAICVACLAKKPEERPTAKELSSRLGTFLGETSTRTYVRSEPFPAKGNHVVICGLGELGMRLALDGRSRGKSIIAIENHGDPSAIEEARSQGVVIIKGDASDMTVLRAARVEQAEFVVAACRKDEINVAIAVSVGELLPQTLDRHEPLVCRLLISDDKRRRLLAEKNRFRVVKNYRINFGDLDLYDTAARVCLRNHNLDFRHIDDETTVHVVVVGFGRMGRSLSLHAARVGHFSNTVTRNRRLRITVVDHSKKGVDTFREQFSGIDRICDLGFHGVDQNLGFVRDLDQLSAAAAANNELVTCAVCLENEASVDDGRNFEIGIELSDIVETRPVQILIYQSSGNGFARICSDGGRGSGISPRLHAFGMREDIFKWDVLLHESEDLLARAVHEDYQRHHRNDGILDWVDLEDNVKESNRHAADHIPVKLRALGYHSETIRPAKERIERFTEDEVLLLARMEHSRWSAERLLAGWHYGPKRDNVKKEHPDLVAWDELSPGEQEKNKEQINAIPLFLDAIGEGIYR